MTCLTTLRQRRDALEESIASGVISITVDGQTTTLGTLSERRAELRRINDEIAKSSGVNPRPRVAQINMGGF